MKKFTVTWDNGEHEEFQISSDFYDNYIKKPPKGYRFKSWLLEILNPGGAHNNPRLVVIE